MTDLTARRIALLAYAQSCLEAGDYHGCRDACTDLEVIGARLEERENSIAARLKQTYDPEQIPPAPYPDPTFPEAKIAWITGRWPERGQPIQTAMRCTRCGGKGQSPSAEIASGWVTCSKCSGTGYE